jgi:hypothetical protein
MNPAATLIHPTCSLSDARLCYVPRLCGLAHTSRAGRRSRKGVVLCRGFAQLSVRGARSLGTATLRPLYAIHHKDGRIEYLVRPPEYRPCAHSLFPQRGYSPCWYLHRHPEQSIEIRGCISTCDKADRARGQMSLRRTFVTEILPSAQAGILVSALVNQVQESCSGWRNIHSSAERASQELPNPQLATAWEMICSS